MHAYFCSEVTFFLDGIQLILKFGCEVVLCICLLSHISSARKNIYMSCLLSVLMLTLIVVNRTALGMTKEYFGGFFGHS